MTKPATTRVPWYEPARFVWWLPWLGLCFAIMFASSVWLISSVNQAGSEWFWALGVFWLLAILIGLPALIIFPYLITAVSLIVISTTAVLLFGSLTRKATVSVNEITDRDLVATEYKSLPRRRLFLNIILWGSTAAIMILQFIPIYPYMTRTFSFLLITRYSIPILHLLDVGYPGFRPLGTPNLSYAAIPVTISLGALIALPFALFMLLLMATLRPNHARLLKRIIYACALALAAVAPLGIFPYFVWFEYGLWFDPSHLDVLNFLAPTYLLLLVSLIWLSFQRARLAGLGARVKVWLRLIALGGVALQAFYLAFWSVFATQNANAGTEVFYVGSAPIGAGLAVAWFGLLLMVGARRNWDWALFGLVAATQIASLIVVYPGLLTA